MSSEVPDGWRSVPLGEVIRLEYGRALSASVREAGNIPVYGSNGICGEHSAALVNERGIVVGRKGTAGSVTVTTGPFWPIDTTYFVAPRVKADFDWMAAMLEHARLSELNEATGVPGLNRDKAYIQPILLPPLDEQRRIAEVLRSVDVAITTAGAVLSQTIEAREHQLERLMALPGDMRPLADVCRLGGGYGFPIKHQGKRSGAYPFAKVSDMNRPGNETELVSAENYVDQADLKVLRAKPFPPGTTFFPKVGATLLTNKRRISSSEIIVDNNVMGAVPTAIESWFLFYAFNTIDMADYVQPGAVPSVNQGTVGKIMIPVPSRKVQRDYVSTMRDLDSAIEAQRATISSLRITKAAVSADLLSGSVRVPA